LHVPRTFLRDNFISIGTNLPGDILRERHMIYWGERIDTLISMKQCFVELYLLRLRTAHRVPPRIPILLKAGMVREKFLAIGEIHIRPRELSLTNSSPTTTIQTAICFFTMLSSALAFASLLVAARAQLAGTNTVETHPPLTVSNCTASGCTTSAQSIVI
jgi:hypothetical protein